MQASCVRLGPTAEQRMETAELCTRPERAVRGRNGGLVLSWMQAEWENVNPPVTRRCDNTLTQPALAGVKDSCN